MGCGGSKSVEVRAPTCGPSSVNNGEINADIPENEINVFEHNINNNNELGGSCYNAKPRLRSAIRRSTDIKPVTESNDNSSKEPDSDIRLPPLEFTDQAFAGEFPFSRDSGFDSNRASGFDSNRAHSEASERPKSSVREETSSVLTSSTMRPDSVLTGSVVTARDLNASFMTMSEDYTVQPNGDVSLDLDVPLDDHVTDFDDSHCRTLSNTPSRTISNTPSRTLSNTPSARPLSSTPSRLVFSTEPLPIPLYPKSIDVIKEESEGGFTPRSMLGLDDLATPRIKLEPPKDEIPKYHYDEVLSHNKKVKWSAWGIYKKMIYDANKVIEVFRDMHAEYSRKENERKKEEWLMELRKDESFDEDCSEEEQFEELKSFDDVYPKRSLSPAGSLAFALRILLNIGIPIHVIEQNLSQCLIGEVKADFSPQYWDSFRKDVDHLLEDLVRKDLRDELSENAKEILEQLQRWTLTYRHHNPQPQPQCVGDPNILEFNIPDSVRENPDCLRRWLEKWERFDLKIPESGYSWHVYDVENLDLGNPQEIFEDSLRSNVDLVNPFITSVDGEAAWEVLELGIVADDVMTEEQKRTEDSRRFRTDLDDPNRMERRRVKLLNYFVKKYEMDTSKVNHFLQWSRAMEEGHTQFQLLCGNLMIKADFL